jgi:tRNA-dihydrouridine synthase
MCKHIAGLCEERGEQYGMREARKHMAWYVRGLKGAPGFRREACEISTLSEMYAFAARVIAANE